MSVPTRRADDVLKALNITHIDDLYLLKAIAWERKALVVEQTLTGAEARVLISRPRSIITISTLITDLNRRRFDLAHELGHLEMHRNRYSIFGCTASDLNSGWLLKQNSPTLEQEANEFAASLLMPEGLFLPLCQYSEPSLTNIRELADLFRVSLTAAAIRYAQYCDEPVAVVYSEGSYIRWYESSRDFDELELFVDVKARLDHKTVASRAFRGLSNPDRSLQVPINAWMRPGHYNNNATLSEQSIFMPSYNAVLSLLWINEIIDGEE